MNKPGDKHILIVEDDRSLADFLSISVGREGFIVTITRDGAGALESVSSSKPDLILLDMMLPQKNGFELLRMFQSPEHRDIPIIAFSGKFKDDDFKKMIMCEPNVKEFMVKPLKPQILLNRIHSLLGTVSPDDSISEEKKRKYGDSFNPDNFERN